MELSSEKFTRVTLGTGTNALSLRLVPSGEMGARSFRLLREGFDPSGPQGLQKFMYESGRAGAFWKKTIIAHGYSLSQNDHSYGQLFLPSPKLNTITSYPSNKGAVRKFGFQGGYTYVVHGDAGTSDGGIVKLASSDIAGGSFTAASENWTYGSAPLNIVANTFAADFATTDIDGKLTVGDVDHASDEFFSLTTVNTPPADDVFTLATGSNSTGIAPLEIAGVIAYAKSSTGSFRVADLSIDTLLAGAWSSEFPASTVFDIKWIKQHGSTTYFGTTGGIRVARQDGTYHTVHPLNPDSRNCPNVTVDAEGFLVTGSTQGIIRYKQGIVDPDTLGNDLSEDLPAQGRGSCVCRAGRWTYFVLQDDAFKSVAADGTVTSVFAAHIGRYRKANPALGEQTAKGLVAHLFARITNASSSAVEVTAFEADVTNNRMFIGTESGAVYWFTLADGDGEPLTDTSYIWDNPSSSTPALTQWPDTDCGFPLIEKIPYWLAIGCVRDADSNRYLFAEYQLDSPIFGAAVAWTKVNQAVSPTGTWQISSSIAEGFNLKQFFLDSSGVHKMTSFINFSLRTGIVSNSTTTPPQFAMPLTLIWLPSPDQAVAYEMDVDLESIQYRKAGGGGDMAKYDALVALQFTRTTLTHHGYGIDAQPVMLESITPLVELGQIAEERPQKKVTLRFRKLDTS